MAFTSPPGSGQPALPSTTSPSGRCSALAPERAEHGHGDRDPIGLLVAQLAGIAEGAGSVGEGGRDRQHRDLVDESWDQLAPHLDRRQVGGTGHQCRPGLPSRTRRLELLHGGTHGGEHVEHTAARGVDADPGQGQFGARHQG